VQERTHPAAAEWKRTKDLGAVLTKEDAHVLVQHLIDTVRDNVLNPAAVRQAAAVVVSRSRSRV
jgi:hypothetical protein